MSVDSARALVTMDELAQFKEVALPKVQVIAGEEVMTKQPTNSSWIRRRSRKKMEPPLMGEDLGSVAAGTISVHHRRGVDGDAREVETSH